MDKKINQKLIKEQYKDPSHLNTRRNLHERYSTNKYGWYKWIFDYFNFPQKCKLLEIGSGLGLLWLNNKIRIPDTWDITLTDFSQQMLDKTKHNLQEIDRDFKYNLVDIQNIPYPDNSFDVLIATHMLYLVPDIKRALAEAARVIKPGGILITTSNGSDNMKELENILEASNLPVHRGFNSYSFSLDNGKDYLSPYFSEIEIFQYKDSLLIDNPEPLIAHILSTNEKINEKQKDEVDSYFKNYFFKYKKLKITKDIGMFIAKKPIS